MYIYIYPNRAYFRDGKLSWRFYVFCVFSEGGSKFENRKTTIYYDGSMIFWIFAEQIIVTVSWFSGCSMQQIIVTFFYNILFFSCFSFFSFSFSFSLFLSIRHFVPYWITSLRSWFQTKSASLRRFAAYLSTLLRSWFHKTCLLPKGI